MVCVEIRHWTRREAENGSRPNPVQWLLFEIILMDGGAARLQTPLNLPPRPTDTTLPGDCAIRTNANTARHHSAWRRCAFAWPVGVDRDGVHPINRRLREAEAALLLWL
jgi:hypothetical protein